ncbi:hypothetical protein [Kordiimonas laminariae]|uniref:hypothetical protein n=1 Tax=Kordiimonas laminariae TaxID=2917717 RepID=UPI001FF295DD|nr:hypothetical protein [Kordiimonas laminariae]MCK0070452.1 hypothetical protein [Kordiimonas laminariae]
MFASNKSLVIATLLTGTAVATGTILYGIHSSETPELVILDDTLPPVIGNGLLPPPATYAMTTPPPKEIPGIRRLKISRPTLQGGESTNEADFYLTGTRSADLIRKPVEARIETFPSVTLEEAVEGALAVDEWGFQVVQSYLNQAMGDADELKRRMDALLAKIEEVAGDYDLTTISDAANLIIEAGGRTHWTAFMSPFVLDRSFKLQDDAIGWDLGPSNYEPYDKFIRVGSESKMLIGDNINDEGDTAGPSILRNGVRNVEQFVASGLKNGRYRVVILTAPRQNGSAPLYPFGVDVKRNDGKINMVDTRATDDIVPLMKLSTEGPGRLTDAGGEAASYQNGEVKFSLSGSSSAPLIASADPYITQGRLSNTYGSASLRLLEPMAQAGPNLLQSGGDNYRPSTGHMLVTRAEVVDGTLRISFRQLGGQDTYVTAVIIYPEADTNIDEELAEQVVEFIQRIAPAAGENLTAENILKTDLPIVDARVVFSDASGGLPTPEADAATPEAPVTGGGGTPPTEEDDTPEPEPDGTPDIGAPNEPEPEPTPDPEPDPEPPTTPDPEPEPPTTPDPEPEPPTTPDPEPEPPTTPDPEPEPPTTPDPEPAPEPDPEPLRLVLDAGGGDDEVYDPVTLGEDFLLDGCGSTFESELVCSLTDSSDFEMVWILDGQEIGTGSQLTVQTGEGTLFDETGNVNITIQVRYDGRLLDDGEVLNIITGGSVFLPGDIIFTSLDTAIISIVAAVPEPGALFLLAPALAYGVRRQRKKKKTPA